MVWKPDRSHGLAQRLYGGGSDRAHCRYRLLVQQAQCRSRSYPGGGYPGDAAAADPGHQSVTNAIVANAKTQSALQLVLASFRSSVPQYRLEVDRVKTEALQVSLDQVFAALAGYLGSTY